MPSFRLPVQSLFGFALFALALCALPPAASAQSFSDTQKGDIEAIAPLRKAVQLSNNSALIEMLLGQALVGTDNKAYTEEAITILRAAVARETEAPLGYTQLAMAYGRKGDYAEADLASAQAAYLRGDNKTARDLASRAKTRFAIGTPGWVKADDIVTAKPMAGQKSN